jgi:hypothetical protein
MGLRDGSRGLLGKSSLAPLLAEHRGHRNIGALTVHAAGTISAAGGSLPLQMRNRSALTGRRSPGWNLTWRCRAWLAVAALAGVFKVSCDVFSVMQRNMAPATEHTKRKQRWAATGGALHHLVCRRIRGQFAGR